MPLALDSTTAMVVCALTIAQNTCFQLVDPVNISTVDNDLDVYNHEVLIHVLLYLVRNLQLDTVVRIIPQTPTQTTVPTLQSRDMNIWDIALEFVRGEPYLV